MGFEDGDGGDKSLGTLILARNLCFDFDFDFDFDCDGDCDGNCDSNLRLHFCRSQIALSLALALQSFRLSGSCSLACFSPLPLRVVPLFLGPR
jgi:hypothetical protein